MKGIYLDNASTTYPKPPEVADEIYHYLRDESVNVNRGGYSKAYDIAGRILDIRQSICDMFHGPDAKNVIFTANITESLNMILKGYLKPSDHVIVSAIEHNAVMRPIVQLSKSGIEFTRISARSDGSMDLDNLDRIIKNNTKMIVTTHASNVCGTINPIEEIGRWAHEHGIIYVVDSAQTAGIIPIDMKKMNIDILAFTGHKGIMGPQGIGGFIVDDELSKKIDPIISGGTGSISHTEEVPEFMPDRFEAGTLNIPGILGLGAGIRYINKYGIDDIYKHEMELTEIFIDGIHKHVPNAHIVGIDGIDGRTGVVSIVMDDKDPAAIAYELDSQYGISVRVGLHCAPNAHKVLGTYPMGTVRLSFGIYNTKQDIDIAISALKEIGDN